MSAPLRSACLLLAAAVSAALTAAPAKYILESGMFANTADSTTSVASRVACSAQCAAMEQWFCGGFTYHDSGDCELYRGDEPVSCPDLEQTAPPLEVNSGTAPRSYRRFTPSACPGTSSSPCACPAGFSRCAGRCLALLSQQLPYTAAEAACDELGAHLAVPRSEAENQCAFQLRDGRWSWLGVSDRATEGVYEGADGCRTLPASGGWWREGDPDNWQGAEHCVGMNVEDRWNDRPCEDVSIPLCQLHSCLQPVCP